MNSVSTVLCVCLSLSKHDEVPFWEVEGGDAMREEVRREGQMEWDKRKKMGKRVRGRRRERVKMEEE